MSRLGFVFLLVVLLIAACDSTGVPRATPTIAPTATPTEADGTRIADLPSRTPVIFTPTAEDTIAPTSTAISTATDLPTATETAQPTQTATLNPSETNSPTPTLTETPSATATATATLTATATATLNPSETNSPTPTNTRTPSSTPTATETAIPTATATATDTRVPSPTPLPRIQATNTATATSTATQTATVSATATATDTPLPSITPSITPTPTATNTPAPPTPDLTREAQGTATRDAINATLTALAPTRTATPSATAPPVPTVDTTQIAIQITQTLDAFQRTQTASAPSATPTRTLPPPPAPTLDVTPTFITGVPPDQGILPTPLPGDGEPQFTATATAVPNPTVQVVVPIPPTITGADFPQPPSPNINNTAPVAFALTTSGGFNIGAISLLGDDTPVNLFARNPANTGQYVATNNAGTFFVVTDGVSVRPDTSPFSRFEGTTAAENQYFVEYVSWASSGQWVAIIIDGKRHPDPTAEDGVHIYNAVTGEIRQLVRDAPSVNHIGYQLGGIQREFLHETQKVSWPPQNDAVLAQVRLTDDWIPSGTYMGAVMYLPLDQDPNVQPRSIRCDYGEWALSGARIVVSGNCLDRAGIIATVNRSLEDPQIVFDQPGIWAQNAIERAAGQYLALGREGDSNGPMRIMNQAGAFLTGDIGTARPSRVEWSPDRSAVLVTAGGRQYVARVSGQVTDITGSVGGLNAINWVTGGLPADAQTNTAATSPDAPPANFIPSGVIQGTRYTAGQQLEVASTELNVRVEPGLSAAVIVALGEGQYVVILAGPANVDGFLWWRVQLASGQTGWLAGEINGTRTLR